MKKSFVDAGDEAKIVFEMKIFLISEKIENFFGEKINKNVKAIWGSIRLQIVK